MYPLGRLCHGYCVPQALPPHKTYAPLSVDRLSWCRGEPLRAVVPRCDTGGATVAGEHGARACYPPSSPSSAFASWRSAVSKPSVNQP